MISLNCVFKSLHRDRSVLIHYYFNHTYLHLCNLHVCLSFHSFICLQKKLVKHFIIFKASDALFIIALNKKKPIKCIVLPDFTYCAASGELLTVVKLSYVQSTSRLQPQAGSVTRQSLTIFTRL